ncbi:hypothetical protein Tco_0047284 [Tanacetum coccineum]
MEQMTSICDMVVQYTQKKEEDRRIAEDQAAKDRYWKIPICYDDDEDYTIAITPVLLTEEPVDSLIMGDEHLDTIPSVENLVPIPSEFEGISDGVDDDDFEDIEYVEASPPDLEIVSLEEVNDVDQEKEEFDLENILQIQDVILREKLLNINRLIANIESLNDNSTPNCVLKSTSPFPIPDSNSFFEKSDTSLSYSDNSLPEFESFSDHTEETSSGSTTTHANNSLPEYDSFHFEIEPDQGGLTSVVMEDILGEPRVHVPNVLPTHPTLMMDSDFIIRTFLPFFTYPVISSSLFSSGSEDTIFDPGISTFHFSSLKPVAYENPIVLFLFICFCPKDKGIRGEIPQDHEDPCLFSILQSSGLRSFAYFGILNPDHPSQKVEKITEVEICLLHLAGSQPMLQPSKGPRYKGLKTKQKNAQLVSCGCLRLYHKGHGFETQEGYNPLHVTSAATLADTWHHVACHVVDPDPTQSRPDPDTGPRPDLTRPKTQPDPAHDPPVDWRSPVNWRSTIVDRWSGGGPASLTVVGHRLLPPLTTIDRWSGGGPVTVPEQKLHHVAPLR